MIREKNDSLAGEILVWLKSLPTAGMRRKKLPDVTRRFQGDIKTAKVHNLSKEWREIKSLHGGILEILELPHYEFQNQTQIFQWRK